MFFQFISGQVLVQLVIIAYLIKSTIHTVQRNTTIEHLNQEAQKEYALIQEQIENIKQDHNACLRQYTDLLNQFHEQEKNNQEKIEEHYQKLYQEQREKYQYKLKQEQEKLEQAKQDCQKQFEQAKQDYQKEYETVMSDAVKGYTDTSAEFQSLISTEQDRLKKIQENIQQEKQIADAAIAANKRVVEMDEKEDFYKLQIPETDLLEIEELRKCAKHLRNAEPLNKVIWKVYYEKPTNDLIGRVIGSGNHCGIYKITNIKNKMCYVGQSLNLADRFRQHIKRGLGAEPATRNKLYPIMQEYGVENFTFEIIEECASAQLNDKEDYWQEFFKAKEFGYSIK